jgi:hypothetical protein
MSNASELYDGIFPSREQLTLLDGTVPAVTLSESQEACVQFVPDESVCVDEQLTLDDYILEALWEKRQHYGQLILNACTHKPCQEELISEAATKLAAVKSLYTDTGSAALHFAKKSA